MSLVTSNLFTVSRNNITMTVARATYTAPPENVEPGDCGVVDLVVVTHDGKAEDLFALMGGGTYGFRGVDSRRGSVLTTFDLNSSYRLLREDGSIKLPMLAETLSQMLLAGEFRWDISTQSLPLLMDLVNGLRAA